MAPVSFHHSSKTVCVMDASGRLGVSLVHKLLQRGYIVHAATYNHGGELHGLKGLLSCDNERLKVFRTDPFDYQSLVDAMKGCAGLFYAFEPPQDQNYDEFMVEVEVRSAHNVLEACARTETMERVVFTSSVAAVVWKENHKLGMDFDERDWSEPNFCRKFKLWHALAKTQAEKTAWALAMDRGVEMASVNAGLVVGPDTSLASPYLKGAPEMYEDGVLVTVDLNFLADAHLAVFETPSAYGRYLCFNRAVCRPEDAVKLAQMLSHASPCPHPSDELRVIQQRIQNKKLNKVMVEFAAGTHLEG
ncbi:cinnamoyl-CoA reductase-like SNL6 isoform X1 [Phoenix dactylifera]|uniref:Cinnamoyl-CoA reductase-like SNL6 isoform X1 n=2 Tax=Phoenix dactylifera TaxID=42345 RepID=A0A8B7BVR9_PHODC|nr:cinnamoyl-CoA reductase-like SNL6 isoform X1 [Phoenix dactylifera]